MKIRFGKPFALFIAALVFPVAAIAADAAMPRSEWHNLVSDCAQSADALKSTIAKLSPSDQCAFLAEVNDAISKMPGSDEAKAAKFYAANRAALQGADPTNRVAVLSEVFATVPVECLTDVNERLASELFSREGSSRTFSDAEFTALAKNSMDAIVARCGSAENAGVREAMAIVMFANASGGSPADLVDSLAASISDEAVRKQAVSEWIPAALGKDGQSKSYDPMLGVAQAGDEPNHAVVTTIVGGPQTGEAMLADLATINSSGKTATDFTAGSFKPNTIAGVPTDSIDIGLNRVPRGALISDVALGNGIRRTSDGRYVDVHGNEVTIDANGNYVDSDGNIVGGNPYKSRKRGEPSGGEPSVYAGQY